MMIVELYKAQGVLMGASEVINNIIKVELPNLVITAKQQL
jgi:hypothetical protein